MGSRVCGRWGSGQRSPARGHSCPSDVGLGWAARGTCPRQHSWGLQGSEHRTLVPKQGAAGRDVGAKSFPSKSCPVKCPVGRCLSLAHTQPGLNKNHFQANIIQISTPQKHPCVSIYYTKYCQSCVWGNSRQSRRREGQKRQNKTKYIYIYIYRPIFIPIDVPTNNLHTPTYGKPLGSVQPTRLPGAGRQ